MLFAQRSLIFLLTVFIIVSVMLPAQVQGQTGLSVVMGNKQYYIDAFQTGNFYEGVHFCAQYDMKLASIENKAEYNRLYTILKTNDALDKAYWLSGHNYGMNDIFTWLGTGRPVNYWGEEGSKLTDTNKCISTEASTFKFKANDCTATLSFICEKPLEPTCGKYGQCRYTYSYNIN